MIFLPFRVPRGESTKIFDALQLTWLHSKFDHTIREEVVDWLYEFVGQPEEDPVANPDWFRDPSKMWTLTIYKAPPGEMFNLNFIYEFGFRRDDHAVLFKLTWGGHV